MTDEQIIDVSARQAIHELATAIAWLAQGTVHELGTGAAGDIIAKCQRVDELIEGAG